MSRTIFVDFSFPSKKEIPHEAPDKRDGIVVHWNSCDEFFPDCDDEDE